MFFVALFVFGTQLSPEMSLKRPTCTDGALFTSPTATVQQVPICAPGSKRTRLASKAVPSTRRATGAAGSHGPAGMPRRPPPSPPQPACCLRARLQPRLQPAARDIDSAQAPPGARISSNPRDLRHVHRYLRATELAHRPCASAIVRMQRPPPQSPVVCNSAAITTPITATMRVRVVDWLQEVSAEARFADETAFLGVLLLDRYLELVPVRAEALQLVGVAALMVASKFEDEHPLGATDALYFTDGLYTKSALLRQESAVLDALRFSVSAPSPLLFASRFVQAAAAATVAPRRGDGDAAATVFFRADAPAKGGGGGGGGSSSSSTGGGGGA